MTAPSKTFLTFLALLAHITAAPLATDAKPALALSSSFNPSSHSPSLPRAEPRSFPIYKKRSNVRTGDDLIAWANQHRAHLLGKYNLPSNNTKQSPQSKRTEGYSTLTNYADDSTWYTSVQIGTPSKSYSLVLDTGSSDVWISVDSYNPSDSSTFVNESTPFEISYGSGDVAGYLAKDTFTIAQHKITGRTFAVATDIGSGLLDGTTDGIVGLGFESLSTSGTEPIWESAGETEFAFYLEKDLSSSDSTSGTNSGNPGLPGSRRSTSDTTPGGVFTLGGANSSLYTGDINWLTVTSESYWTVQLGGISVQSYSAGIGSLKYAAIDTGTTLMGGPENIIEELYSQISGSAAISSADGYYSYPCDTTVTTTITFGNQKYSLSSDDFKVSEIGSGQCMGALFSVGTVTSSSSLDWIVGDVFLKGVYSIFSASNSTAKVGFASLASGLNNDSTSSTSVSQTQSTSGSSAISSPFGFSTTLAMIMAFVAAVLLQLCVL